MTYPTKSIKQIKRELDARQRKITLAYLSQLLGFFKFTRHGTSTSIMLALSLGLVAHAIA